MTEEKKDPDKLDLAFDGLERDTPERVSRAIRWLRDPAHKWIRLPIGIALIATGFFGFLPVIGFEFIPLGLLFIAQDIPVLREPVGRMVLWLEKKWHELRAKWRSWRRKS